MKLNYIIRGLKLTRSGLTSNLCRFNPTHPKPPKVPNTSYLSGGNRRGRLLMTVDIPSLSNKRHRANMVIKSSSHLHLCLTRSVSFILGKEIPDLVYCTQIISINPTDTKYNPSSHPSRIISRKVQFKNIRKMIKWEEAGGGEGKDTTQHFQIRQALWKALYFTIKDRA